MPPSVERRVCSYVYLCLSTIRAIYIAVGMFRRASATRYAFFVCLTGLSRKRSSTTYDRRNKYVSQV